MSITSRQQAHLGADIGGTFTDVVLELDGCTYSTKVLTTYDAPERAIIDGMHRVCAKAGVTPAAIGRIIHGTTLATNALIERRGAKTALITTAGFRDVIEMRTEGRFEQYDLNLKLPLPLLPRNRRYTLRERIGASGATLIPLVRNDVVALADEIAVAGYESVAVGLIHSYLDPAHERLVRDVLLERIPHLSVSISSEVSPQMREYERFNTVVANAYVKPMMKRYLASLAAKLAVEGAACPIFLMHSGGGIMSLESAAEFPVRLVESGPAGGAIYAAHVAARFGFKRVLSFDMGGTTAKICLIKDQTPKTSRVFEVARSYRFKKGSGMPISIPVIDMVEIGAGGGSLAGIDSMRQIRVGPESAGSEPGPACYGRGGSRPTVTDADVMLGKIDPANFAGGTMVLDVAASRQSVTATIADRLDMTDETAAFGIVEVVDENMANAARVHAVENGEDLSGYTMIAFGGAAPLHAGRLCEKLGIQRLMIPPGAGVGSAIGFLRAPFSFEATRSVYTRLTAFDADTVRGLLSELEHEATTFVRSCDAQAPLGVETKLYMRYVGQGWEIPIDVTGVTPSRETYQQMFEAEYEKLFSRIVRGLDIEITVWAVNASTTKSMPLRADGLGPLTPLTAAAHRELFDPTIERRVRAAVFQRSEISVGRIAAGPCIIVEDETTIIVPASCSATCRSDGCIEVFRHDAKPADGHSTNMTQLSTVSLQVMWNRLISIVEEQAQALIRTAFSTSVREAGDLSTGVYNVAGSMLAQAVTGTPGHVNAMADAVAHFIREIGPANICEDDIYITNDPWMGTGHLHDITVVTPSFHKGRHIGFFACTAHVVDIGGRGFGADGNSVYEEGLYIPIMKLADQGRFDQPFVRLVRANVREPDQVVGDIFALATCNDVGRYRLTDMLDEFELDHLEAVGDFILENSRRATLERIAALATGEAEASLISDGFSTAIELKVKVTIAANSVSVDFAGSSGVDPKGINCPMVYSKAYACYALKCAIAPEIPNNAASLEPFRITAPENTIVNALHPAPVALRNVIGHLIPDAVYNALDRLLSATVPAEGAGPLCNFQVSLRPASEAARLAGARRAEVLTFNCGGSGARPTLDGMNTTAFPSGVMTMPIEATEHTGPIIIWRKELRPDSGGSGQYRGGLGQFMEVGAAQGHVFDLSAMFDRLKYPPRGRLGGGAGAPTELHLDDGTPLAGKGRQPVGEGRTVMLALPGGGGYGAASDRNRVEILRDLALGYISATAAKAQYGLSEADIAIVEAGVRRGELPYET